MKSIKISIAALFIVFSMGALNQLGACNSGGEGASSCSDSGTVTIMGNTYSWDNSVTCQEGYYACCGMTGAECIENGDSEPQISE